ncbi:hypothetical protein DOTSEDRAFT_33971 [Dothistroma septosporum NZE10]|uniref:Uncharacterized protein n=1 Tax=Dothistroma septosporum (strain NZE10 / CBS 128990) TaxID=675120 RepID=N1PRB2_DOTSN|nr:hypothetical protein DOTSEDRAFT_33971 [Dothistroma septosporum NZE10]
MPTPAKRSRMPWRASPVMEHLALGGSTQASRVFQQPADDARMHGIQATGARQEAQAFLRMSTSRTARRRAGRYVVVLYDRLFAVSSGDDDEDDEDEDDDDDYDDDDESINAHETQRLPAPAACWPARRVLPYCSAASLVRGLGAVTTLGGTTATRLSRRCSAAFCVSDALAPRRSTALPPTITTTTTITNTIAITINITTTYGFYNARLNITRGGPAVVPSAPSSIDSTICFLHMPLASGSETGQLLTFTP